MDATDTKVTARCMFHGEELSDVPVLNPGDWFGKAWLLEIQGGFTPLFLVVEADDPCDTIDELSDSDYGHEIHVDDDNLEDYPEDERHYDGSGRVIDDEHVMIHGSEGWNIDLPYAMTYHCAKYPDGVDPRKFTWEDEDCEDCEDCED